MCRVELARMFAALRGPLNIFLALAAGLVLVACTGGGFSGNDFFSSQPAAPQQSASQIGQGQEDRADAECG